MKKKDLRMIVGIILHPVRIVWNYSVRRSVEYAIRQKVALSWEHKNWQRMHEMSLLTNTAYTSSELYKDLRRGAF